MNTHLSRNALLLTFLLTLVFYSSLSFSSAVSVHSISKTIPPLQVSDGVKVQTITRSFAANAPVYKAALQTIPKALFLTTFRTAVRFSPFGLVVLAGTKWFLDKDKSSDTYGEIITYESEEIGDCNYKDSSKNNKWAHNVTINDCLALSGSVRAAYNSAGTVINMYKYPLPHTYSNSGLYNIEYSEPRPTVIGDNELYELTDNYFKDEKYSREFFLNADGTVNQDYFDDLEFDLINQSDVDLMAQYGSGLLQSDDPLLDNYVTPEELARIKELYDYEHRTDDEVAEELTVDAKEPMTRSEYANEQILKEARLKDDAQSLNSADTSQLDKTTQLDEQFNLLDGMMNNLNPIPAIPAVPIFTYSSSCRQMTIEANIPTFGIVGSVAFPSALQCEKILNPLKDMMGWLVFMSVSFLIIIELLREIH